MELLEPRWLCAAQLIQDINPTPFSAYVPPTAPTPPVVAGGYAYFAQAGTGKDVEPWRTDGTPGGTVRVKDVLPGPAGSMPNSFFRVGNKVVFYANPGGGRTGLWASDGTDAGTTWLGRAYPKAGTIVPAGPRTFFVADDGVHGQEWWVSDGTPAGTHLVLDSVPGTNGIALGQFGTDGSRLYYQTTAQPTALMASDGTAAGTGPVTSASIAVASPIVPYGGGVAFVDSSRTIWTSDGTAGGTSKLLESSGVYATGLYDGGNGVLLLVGSSTSEAGTHLYRFAPGGTAVTNVLPGTGLLGTAGAVAQVGGATYFVAVQSGSSVVRLYRVGAGATAAAQVSTLMNGSQFTFSAADLVDANGTLYFRTSSGRNEATLWRVPDAAGASPVAGPVAQLQTADSSYVVQGLAALGNGVVFLNYDAAHQVEVWGSDGTAAGTGVIKDVNADTLGSYPLYPTALAGGGAVFSADDGAHGSELWFTDGTAAGTRLVKDIAPGAGGSNPWRFKAVRNRAYFLATDPAAGEELWSTDGTAGGTYRVADVRPGTAGAAIDGGNMTVADGVLYFTADDGTNGGELWRTDGTAAGTYQVVSIRPGTASAGIAEMIAAPGGGILFAADDGVHGFELWRSDGTAAGTRMVKDINATSGGAGKSIPLNFVTLGGQVLFNADDGVHGREMWRTDGTEAGTQLVADIRPGSDYSIIGGGNGFDPTAIAYHGYVYFVARAPDYGYFVYRTNGTAGGTAVVSDQARSFYINAEFAVVRDRLVFAYSTGSSAGDFNELWASDGTAAGTARLLPSGTLANAAYFHLAGGRLFFIGQSPDYHRTPLWSTDGTPEGTVVVTPDLDGTFDQMAVLPDNSLILNGNDGTHGAEPWRVTDVWAPVAGPSTFEPGPRPRIAVGFSEAVGASLSAGDLVVRDAATGQAVDVGTVTLAYDAGADRAVFTLGRPLGDGNYRVELKAGSVTDAAGNPLAQDYASDFFVLAGDANRDRVVNFADLLALAKNYNKSGATWADGDFTGDGVVNFADLLILAKAYNKAVPVPAPVAAVAAAVAVPVTTNAVLADEGVRAKPVFSTTPVTKPAPPKPGAVKPKVVAKPKGR